MTIFLPTEASKPVTELGKQSILLYANPKLGKSTFASKAPGALFFECEPGLNHLEVFKVPTYSWEAFLEACKLVAKGDHNFKTIVIDTVDNAFKMCSDYVCAKHGIEYEGDMGHGKGWALVKNEWHRVLTRLASLPYGLILISHAIDKTIETRTGEYTKTTPSLPDRARNVVLGLVDIILFGDSVAKRMLRAMLRSNGCCAPSPIQPTRPVIALAVCLNCYLLITSSSSKPSSLPLAARKPAPAAQRRVPRRQALLQQRLNSYEWS